LKTKMPRAINAAGEKVFVISIPSRVARDHRVAARVFSGGMTSAT
jgi:hypothetical protein